MKTESLGSYTRVTCSTNDVAKFNASWPCSPIPVRRICFEFHTRTGDLVDISPDSASFDGPALLALANDAQKAAGLSR